MTKRQLIDEIVHLNPTAGAAFLAEFEDSDLAEYLQHLHWVASPPAQPTRLAEPVHSADDLGPLTGPPSEETVAAAVGAAQGPSSFAQQSPEEDSQTWLF